MALMAQQVKSINNTLLSAHLTSYAFCERNWTNLSQGKDVSDSDTDTLVHLNMSIIQPEMSLNNDY